METNDGFDVDASWDWLLQEIALISGAPQAMGFKPGSTNGAAQLVLSTSLFPLLYVRLVSLFDESLAFYVEREGLSIPNRYGSSLHGKLNFLEDQRLLEYTEELREIKSNRNNISHKSKQPYSALQEVIGYNELQNAVDIIESNMQTLGLITYSNRPQYIWTSEISALKELQPEDPSFAEVIAARKQYYGIKKDGHWVIRVESGVNYLRN